MRHSIAITRSFRPKLGKVSHLPLTFSALGLRACLYSQASDGIHTDAHSREQGKKSSRRSFVFALAAGSTFGVTAAALLLGPKQGEQQSDDGPLAHLTLGALLRRYIVYACCSSKTLMDWSPAMIEWSQKTSIPGIRNITQWFMLHTFFPQFVGGQTAEECKDLVRAASLHSIGSIFAYSAEADIDSVTHSTYANCSTDDGSLAKDDPLRFLLMDKVDEYMQSIRVAGQLNEEERALAALKTQHQPSATITPMRTNSVLVAVKLSGLLRDSNVLERASAAIVPRESFSDPPTTLPPSARTIARGATSELMIPTASLEEDDVDALKALWQILQQFAQCAQANGNVRILIDAEYSWYQPAIDALFESCAQQFNRLPRQSLADSVSSALRWRTRSPNTQIERYQDDDLPLIYNTYQAYLRRTPAYLAMSMERARVGKYSLGVKLVRGAYVEVENALWQDAVVPTPPGMDRASVEATKSVRRGEWRSPVWPSKSLTDESYNMCARLLVECVANNVHNGSKDMPQVGVVFAGHNWKSAIMVIEQMLKNDLALRPPTAQNDDTNSIIAPQTSIDDMVPYRNLHLAKGVRGRIHLGQLYGMADDLTYAIQCAFDIASGGDGPHVALKYIPYGDLALVMPYLTRRAQENKSVMGDGRAKRERAAITSELWRRAKTSLSGST